MVKGLRLGLIPQKCEGKCKGKKYKGKVKEEKNKNSVKLYILFFLQLETNSIYFNSSI